MEVPASGAWYRAWPGSSIRVALVREGQVVAESTVSVGSQPDAPEVRLSGPERGPLTRPKLQAHLAGSNAVAEIRPNYRDAVLEPILSEWRSYGLVLSIAAGSRTAEPGTTANRVQSGGFRITDAQVLAAVADFVDRQINSQIVAVPVRIVEASTGTAIPNVEVRYRSRAPAKLQLAQRYFSGDLSRRMVERIGDYAVAEGSIGARSGSVTLRALAGSTLELEFVQRDYQVISSSLTIEQDDQVTAYLVTSGSEGVRE